MQQRVRPVCGNFPKGNSGSLNCQTGSLEEIYGCRERGREVGGMQKAVAVLGATIVPDRERGGLTRVPFRPGSDIQVLIHTQVYRNTRIITFLEHGPSFLNTFLTFAAVPLHYRDPRPRPESGLVQRKKRWRTCCEKMHSNWSEYSHRRQYSDKRSRQWDDSKEWEDGREPHRENPRDSYHKYRGDGHSNTDRMSRSREYGKDALSRDWSRKSPPRRRMSSPVSDGAEMKRRRFTEDTDYRYRHESPEKTHRPSPDGFSHEYISKDFKYALHEEEFKNRETSLDSRPKPWRTEFSYRKHDGDDINDRGFSGVYQDRDDHKRRHDSSQEKARSPDCFSKNYTKTKERTETLSTSVYHQNRARFPLNGSSGQAFESDATPADPEQKSSKGFQRFLDVLNKGVNVDVLTKIVTQTSTHEVSDEHGSLVNAADHTWSPSPAQRQQKHHPNNSCWSERSHSRASPQPHRRSLSPNSRSASDENPAQRVDFRESLFGSRSKSPSVEKMTLTAEDEQKHRQMQDVLQAIGVDLGFEELGQMSHRIQERLYGKKDADCSRKSSREQGTRERYSSNRRSRSSSSSGSNCSPLSHDCHMKKDSLSAQSDKIEEHRSRVLQPGCGESMGAGFAQDSEESNTTQYTERSTAAVEAFPPNPSYIVTQPPVAPAMPTYSPINCSLLPFPPPPPILSPLRPGLFLPHLPTLLPYPHLPPPNIFPPVLAQTRHLFPPHVSNPQPQQYSPPDASAVQVPNKTQKSKAQARPRCLQVIK